MILESCQFVKISDNKVPKHSLDTTYSYEQIKDEPSVAVLISEPYVVYDFDNVNHFNSICEIIKGLDIKCRIMKSTRGGHVWFKSGYPLTNKVDTNTVVSLHTDIKSWGKNNKKSLVTVKLKGVWRTWLKEDVDIDDVPFWLMPSKTSKDFYGLKNGDGREPELFSYIIPLIKQGYDKSQIFILFNIINNYVFDDPLTEQEINNMFDKNNIFEKKELHFYEKNKFKHNVFADWLIDSYCFKSYNNQLYIYRDGLYIKDDDEIYRKMIEQIPSITRTNMAETLENLRLKITSQNQNVETLKVNVQNGVYDLEANQFIEPSPNYFCINQLACEYNPKAKNSDVDYMLDSIACHESSIRKTLEQLLGYMLIGDNRCQKSFILLGEGSNGKSKFLEMILNWLGINNCSTLALEDLNDRFRTSLLVGKIANIGDDSGADLLKNTAIFKKIVTGDSITIEQKFGCPFSFKNTSKLIFSANSLPPSSDKSNGFFRRMVIIPFMATFKTTDKNYDPNIIDKLSTVSAKSYLLNIAIENALEILKTNTLQISEKTENINVSYQKDNNNVLQWFDECTYLIDNRSQQEIYTDYCLYCDANHTLPVQLRRFNAEIVKIKPTYKVQHIIDGSIHSWVWKKDE